MRCSCNCGLTSLPSLSPNACVYHAVCLKAEQQVAELAGGDGADPGLWKVDGDHIADIVNMDPLNVAASSTAWDLEPIAPIDCPMNSLNHHGCQTHLQPDPHFGLRVIPPDSEFSEDTDFILQRRNCGKWTKEEQAFANRLIDDFYRGVSQGVENGQSLRTHLAQRLRCDPLRISKRFAGSNCLGKVNRLI